MDTWCGCFRRGSDLAAAAGVSMVLFGLAHFYQGVKFGVRAFFTGAAMGLLLALLTRLHPARHGAARPD